MKIKSILGICSCKGCRKRYDFEVEIRAGKRTKNIRLCEVHARELANGATLKSVTLDDVTISIQGGGTNE